MICAHLAFAALASQVAADDFALDLQRFSNELVSVRTGDDARAAELIAAAEELCVEHSRCDARDVARHYIELSASERARGLEAEARWGELRAQIVAAGARGLSGDDWAVERARVIAELRALAARVEREPDFVPAARARALIARVEIEQAGEARRLDPTTRAELLSDAERELRAADAAFERAGHLTPRVETGWLAARLRLARGDTSGARAGFVATYELATRVRADEFREHALRGLAAIAREAGDVREETRALERIAEFRDATQSWPLARDWGVRLLHEDHAALAVDFLARHAPAADAHVLERTEWELTIGSARLRLGEVDAAREHFERVAAGPSPELALLALASLALREGEHEVVLELLGAGEATPDFSPRGVQQARALRGEAYFRGGDFARAAEELTLALESAERAENEAFSAFATTREHSAGATGSVIGERLGLHSVAVLAAAHCELGRGVDALHAIERAQSRSLRAEDELDRAALASWAAHFELGLATWVVGADFTLAVHAFVDARGELDVACARIAPGRAALRDATRRVRESLLAGDTRRAGELADEIRATLWPDALAAHLRLAAESRAQSADAPRLLWLAHGPIEELAIELIDLAPLAGVAVCPVVLPGLPANEPGIVRAASELGPWTLIGAPLDATGREELPGARDELVQVAELWPGAALEVGAVATRARMLAAFDAGRPAHVATHVIAGCDGAFGGFAPVSLLANAGERLCVADIAALESRPPLVVLAACSTAAGERVDAEGLQGLARALLGGRGGTRNLVATLWPVEDGAAAHFARALHERLRAGDSPSRAVASARAALRDAGFDSADWAAFRALGRE